MRVKLSYTVDADDVLKESAKILSLAADDLQQAVALFNDVQKELRGENDDTAVPNVSKALEMIEEHRRALLNVDTRLDEVHQIVKGYAEYQLQEGSLPRLDDTVTPGNALEDSSLDDASGAD